LYPRFKIGLKFLVGHTPDEVVPGKLGTMKLAPLGVVVAKRGLDDALRELLPLIFLQVGFLVVPVLEFLESIELLRERFQGPVGGQSGWFLSGCFRRHDRIPFSML
jgi:hypothetical protein